MWRELIRMMNVKDKEHLQIIEKYPYRFQYVNIYEETDVNSNLNDLNSKSNNKLIDGTVTSSNTVLHPQII